LVINKIEAKNGLESYLVNIKHSMNDEKLKDKITADDRETVNKKLTEAQSWLDSHPDAETSEYERQQKEVEDLFNPIMSKIYQAAGGQPGGFPGGFPGGAGGPAGGPSAGGSGSTPKVDEVD
jgi:heat shock protein 1/8